MYILLMLSSVPRELCEHGGIGGCVHNVCGVSRGKGDRTGKLYWASFVERPELAGISGRALPGRDTHKPGTMLGHQGHQGRPGQSQCRV